MKDHVTPSRPSVPLPREALEPCGRTAVVWLGSAGFLINVRGTLLLIDPVLCTQPDSPLTSEIGLKLVHLLPVTPEELPVGLTVLYTHSDEDHLAAHTAQLLGGTAKRLLGPPPVFEKLIRLNVPPQKAESCRMGERLRYGEAEIEVFPADHPWQLLDPGRFGPPFRPGDCCGYYIRTPDVNFFISGDTRLMEEHLSLSGVELLGLDVSPCSFHLGEQAHVLANLLGDCLLLPCHYGTYDASAADYAHLGDPAEVLCRVKNADSRLLDAAPGEPIWFLEHKRLA